MYWSFQCGFYGGPCYCDCAKLSPGHFRNCTTYLYIWEVHCIRDSQHFSLGNKNKISKFLKNLPNNNSGYEVTLLGIMPSRWDIFPFKERKSLLDVYQVPSKQFFSDFLTKEILVISILRNFKKYKNNLKTDKIYKAMVWIQHDNIDNSRLIKNYLFLISKCSYL